MVDSEKISSAKPTFRPYDAAMRDRLLGERGSPDREAYEFELSLELLAEKIKALRKERKLTQRELGSLIGVGKAQISKLEGNTATLTVATFLNIMRALGTSVKMKLSADALHLP